MKSYSRKKSVTPNKGGRKKSPVRVLADSLGITRRAVENLGYERLMAMPPEAVKILVNDHTRHRDKYREAVEKRFSA